MATVLRLQAIAIQSGLPVPGIDSGEVVDLAQKIENIPQYARQLQAFRDKLNAWRPTLWANATFQDADTKCRDAMDALTQANGLASDSYAAALADGTLADGEGLQGLRGFLAILGLAALVVAVDLIAGPILAILVGVVAAIDFLVGAIQVLARNPEVSNVIDSGSNAIQSVSGLGVVALLAGGLFIASKFLKTKSAT